MYVWFLIFWIIYNTPPLFLTMQLSLIIKNSWFPWKELQLYCKNFFIYSDCFSSFDRLLLTFESNLFVEAFFFLLFFLLWLLFQLQNFLKKLTFESNLFNATLLFPIVFSLPAACHWWPWWPQVGTPNLQVLLLLPSFATLVSTIYGCPQKCPPYLTQICPISTFSFSYLPLPL